MRTILILSLTKPLRTKWSLPARRALAATINHVTLPIILTLAGLLAVLAIGPVWALFLTHISCISWQALAPPINMVTLGSIVTITLLQTPCSVQARGAGVSAHSSLPAWRALADSCHRVAVPLVLAVAGVGAV